MKYKIKQKLYRYLSIAAVLFSLVFIVGCNKSSIITEETEVLVIGGGTSGVVAAIQSARLDCKTILIESGSQLGGTMTTGGVVFPGLFHAWGKQVIKGIGWELVSEAVKMNGDVLPDFSKPTGKRHWEHQILINGPLYVLLAEEKALAAGVTIRYYETPLELKKKGDYWIVTVVGKGTHYKIKTKQIIDCTGNASIAALAGYNRLHENETQPGSLIFELEGFDYASLNESEVKSLFEKALSAGMLLKSDGYNGIHSILNTHAGLSVQHVKNANSSTSSLHTQANIDGRASLLRILRFVRTIPGCEYARIKKMQPETAVRETYRIDGEYQITVDDYVGGKVFEDALSYTFYPIDMHVEEGVDPKHLEEGMVPTVPLRALIPKSSENFIVAGRCVSSDRLANSALRVQASCMGMGQVAGVVAAIACKYNTSPLNVPLDEIKKILKEQGGIVPE